ncbi:hypothetical protein HYT84_03285 [Candidatus Micrarchaeota archaeon]|nr:hypothetical protein [Candidatus Micrarchaeota archaeon]
MTLFILDVIGAVALIIALVFSVKLYLETDRKWYWLFFCLAAFAFMAKHWIEIVWLPGIIDPQLSRALQKITEILGGLFLALACYGLYFGMKNIRERVE